MLNIIHRISLSRKSKNIVKRYWKVNNGVLTANSWSAINRSVKNELSRKLLVNQQYKCVYCERYLLGLGHEIDHFAHKAQNSQYSFNPVNLYYSCHFCNSSSRKGQKNVVIGPSMKNYNELSFRIIHPYFDDVNSEIIFKDADRVDFDWDNCSDKGKNTIDFFGFDDLEMTTIRSRQLVFERLNPLTIADEENLIFKAIAYR